MLLGVITLFPDMFKAVTDYGVTRKSIQNGTLFIKLWNPRDFTNNKYRKVDDHPYGGGPGMVMMVQPLRKAINQSKHEFGNNTKVIYLSPQGKKLNQKAICKLVDDGKSLILVCGRYQGIDERLIKMDIDEEWSIGDYVLSGGELAAMIFIDTISRILPNTLNNQGSMQSNSFFINRLGYPNYTKPRNFEGMMVPSILLSGNHKNIYRWRLKQALGNTWIKRPDLFQQSSLTEEEKILLTEFQNEYLFYINKISKKNKDI